MPFHILQNSLTADATDVNDNFYWIGQGSRLPMGGNSLTSTDATYDLGSSIATWNNLHCENIYINASINTADKSLWVLQAETTLSATAGSIEFTGLNGDVDLEYKIIMSFPDVGANVLRMIFNGDSAANYGYQRIIAADAAVGASRGTSQVCIYPFYLWDMSSGSSLCEMIINAKTGLPRMAIYTFIQGVTDTTSENLTLITSVWNDTANTLTTIKFYATGYSAGNGYMGTNTNIQLWKRS